MIFFNFDEENLIYSICDSKSIDKVLSVRIDKGDSCSFLIEPVTGIQEFTIGNWTFIISKTILTSDKENIDDTIDIEARENNEYRILNIYKQKGKFETQEEILTYISNAIDIVVEGGCPLGKALFLDEEKKVILSVAK